MSKKEWSEPGAVEDAEIRGKKPLWVVASFANFVGPESYFTFGRKR